MSLDLTLQNMLQTATDYYNTIIDWAEINAKNTITISVSYLKAL